jgi:hypothetical protein
MTSHYKRNIHIVFLSYVLSLGSTTVVFISQNTESKSDVHLVNNLRGGILTNPTPQTYVSQRGTNGNTFDSNCLINIMEAGLN